MYFCFQIFDIRYYLTIEIYTETFTNRLFLTDYCRQTFATGFFDRILPSDICPQTFADRLLQTDFCRLNFADRLWLTDFCQHTFAKKLLQTDFCRQNFADRLLLTNFYWQTFVNRLLLIPFGLLYRNSTLEVWSHYTLLLHLHHCWGENDGGLLLLANQSTYYNNAKANWWMWVDDRFVPIIKQDSTVYP